MLTNPILKNFKNFLSYVIVWLIITSAYVLVLIFGEQINISIAVADAIIFNILLAGFGISFWYPVQFISAEEHSIPKLLLNHVIGSLVTVSLWLLIGYFITSNIVNSSNEYSEFFLNNIGWRFLVGILFYFLINSFYYLIIYYTNFHEKSLKENELRNLVTQAELKSLKFQINPHFIFNSLNSMSALTNVNPDKARSMILKLAEFLRYTLVNNEQQKNKLSEELRSIRLYLEIEKIRFEDKFDYNEDVSLESRNILVPSMILQPLIENAIKHAVYESLEKVTLKFKGTVKDGFLNLSLENNFDETIKYTRGTGIGLQNINNRLKLIYGLNNLMKVEKTSGIFRVNLYIPVSS